ncbi:MAG TPA: UDP-3-O-(3-hydroxymyristoyl)glucosamine N-acyltransferase [Nitrospira sp.]|nr:UDP-3-O-(3-hydroxymyristoyl)glucosamine N-acyltransferase [Nitrospira sp.]
MSAPSAPGPITLAEIHRLIGGTLHGNDQTTVFELAGLNETNPRALSFVANDKVLQAHKELPAGALLVHRHLSQFPIPQIVVGNPFLAFTRVAEKFFVRPPIPRGIAGELTQGTDVRIGADASIWPFVTLGDRVTIGARVTLYPGVFIGSDSTVGDDCILYPNVVVREGCTLGARVIIHSGSVIGSDGFGYLQHQGRHHKIPQIGGVVIEDDVEVGANVTIDRATMGRTVIKQGTKIDNLVQIAHNVTVGAHTIIVGQVGIAGSTTIGHHVMIGGQAGISDHVQIGDQVMIAARAGVTRNVESYRIMSGTPAQPHESSLRIQAVINHLPELRQLVRSLEQRVETLEAQRQRPASQAGTTATRRGRKH